MTRQKSIALVAIVFVMLVAGCRRSHANEATSPHAAIPFKPLKIVDPAYVGGLKGDWMDFGWVDHPNTPGKPASMSFANHGGWILFNPHPKTDSGGLRFAYRTAHPFGDFLEVRFDAKSAAIFPRVRVLPVHTRARADGFTEVFVSTMELNPKRIPFDRVVIRAFKDVPDEPIDFNDVGLTERDPTQPLVDGRPAETGPGRATTLSIQCQAPSHAISPLIYGIAYAPRLDAQGSQQFELGATIRRWGGNPTSRYNWELGNAWNAGSDYFYKNLDYTGVRGFTYETFLEDQLVRGLKTALTVPTIGYVAKDTHSVGFPADVFGQQQEMDPDQGTAGNGVSKKGVKLESGPPGLTSIEATPEFIGRWIHAIREKDKKRGRTVSEYILDNEPALWNDTHRDLHPKPTSYDELLDKTLRYGAAIRKEDPDAVIAGPAEWGWPAYFASALDQTNGNADRRAHGDVPMIPWLLRNVRAYEQKNSTKILNVLDVHYYPQAKGVGINTQGRTDADGAALRIRSTRSLWDPRYRDESWIGERIELIPRLQRWVAENDPGLGVSIGEWNFGAEQHISGGLAVAEVLGRFGQLGLSSAFYWTYPPSKSPASYAFRAYRNYDGKGAHFLDASVATTMTDSVSLFASKDPVSGKLVAVVLNLDPDRAADATVELQGCPAGTRLKRVFTYEGDEKGFTESLPPQSPGVHLPALAPYSITVLELSP